MNDQQVSENLEPQKSESTASESDSSQEVSEQSRESRPFVITVSEDKLQASLSFKFDNKSPIVTKEQILAEIQNMGIDDQCLDKTSLAEAFTAQNETPACIASGVAPIHGTDTELKHLVDNRENLTPKADKLGNVNHKDVLDFPVVEIGTPLLQRIPGKRAVDGTDVFGQIISANPGQDKELGALGEGTRFSENDQNTIVADVKGHPVFSDDSVYVDPVLRLPAVDLKSGDIKFEGSVYISGDVSPGYCVDATGNVTVTGIVERAKIIAGQDIHINGGVIGSQTEHDAELDDDTDVNHDDEKDLTAVLEAGGSIEAKFLTMCSATAGKDIQISDSAVQSNLKVLGDLTIGNGSGKGALVGGHCEVSHFASINVIGSDANVRTTFMVGELSSLHEIHESLKQEFDDSMEQLLQLSKIHKQLKQSPNAKSSDQVKEKLKKISNTVDSLRKSVDELTGEMTEITTRMKEASHARLEVNKRIYPNVSLTINHATEIIRELKSPGTYQAKGKKIQMLRAEGS